MKERRYELLPFAPVPYRIPQSPSLGQSFDGYFGWPPAVGDGVRLFFHSMTAYLGVHVGLTERGFLSFFGFFLGVGQAVGAICDAASLVERALGTHPPEPSPAPKPQATTNAV